MRVTWEFSTLVVVLALMLSNWRLQTKLYKVIQSTRFDDWIRLGAPSLWTTGRGRSFSYVRFVWFGGYRSLNDPKISQICQTLRAIDITAFVLLLVYGAILFVAAPRPRWG